MPRAAEHREPETMTAVMETGPAFAAFAAAVSSGTAGAAAVPKRPRTAYFPDGCSSELTAEKDGGTVKLRLTLYGPLKITEYGSQKDIIACRRPAFPAACSVPAGGKIYRTEFSVSGAASGNIGAGTAAPAVCAAAAVISAFAAGAACALLPESGRAAAAAVFAAADFCCAFSAFFFGKTQAALCAGRSAAEGKIYPGTREKKQFALFAGICLPAGAVLAAHAVFLLSRGNIPGILPAAVSAASVLAGAGCAGALSGSGSTACFMPPKQDVR